MPMQIKPVKSVAMLATLTIVVVVLSASSLLLSLRARELRHAHAATLSLAQMAMEQTEKNFSNADLVLQGIQERLATPLGRELGLGSRLVQLLLSSRAAGAKSLNSIFLVDANGVLVNSSREPMPAPHPVSDRDYFRVFAEGRGDIPFLGAPARSRVDNGWTLFLARRLSGRDGSFAGVVVAAIDVEDLEASFDTLQLDYARPIQIYTTEGLLVASLPHRDDLLGMPAPELATATLPAKPGEIASLRGRTEAGGNQQLVLGKLLGFPLMLGVIDIEEQSLLPWREIAIPVTVGVLLVCVFTALVAMYLIGKLRRKEVLQTALDSANARYQHTVDSVMDAIVAVDEHLTILLFNPAAEIMFGRSAKDTLGNSLEILIPSHLRGMHGSHMRQFTGPDHVLPRTVVPQRDILGLRSDGSIFPIESTFSKSVVDGHLQLTAVLRDATDKQKAQRGLRDANRQLRELTRSMTEVREQERSRFSRELHDDLGQQLTGLKLSLSWLGNRIKEGRATEVQNVDDMRHQLDTAIGSVRRIAAELRPRVLDDKDFAEALTWQTQEFTRHSGLEVTLQLEAGDLVRDNDASTALFRIVQEALTNVVRHAQATQVRISLTEWDGNVVLTIHDNGVAFDRNERDGAGVGLIGMRERCTSIGGNFEIESVEGVGTTISVSVPMAHLLEKVSGMAELEAV